MGEIEDAGGREGSAPSSFRCQSHKTDTVMQTQYQVPPFEVWWWGEIRAENG